MNTETDILSKHENRRETYLFIHRELLNQGGCIFYIEDCAFNLSSTAPRMGIDVETVLPKHGSSLSGK